MNRNAADSILNVADSILIVDDAPRVCALVARSLADLPYRMITADSVQTGLKALLDIELIRMVVVDFGLPDGTGLEIIEAARKLKPGLPALLMSGYYVGEADVDFIQKPFDPLDLYCRVEALAGYSAT